MVSCRMITDRKNNESAVCSTEIIDNFVDAEAVDNITNEDASAESFSYDVNNVFYKIIHCEMPATIIKENANFIAFRDIFPQAKHHILCIPRAQYINFTHLAIENPQLMHEMTTFILSVVQKLKITNYKLLTNCGAGAGQIVMHFHMHIMSDD